MWAELRSRPAERNGVLLAAVLLLLHQLVHRAFFIDDAAIVFTFVRNIASGEGVVPWPGGERVEGYSDPAWVALLTLFQLVGINGFWIAKPLAVVLGWLTLPLLWRTARMAMPDDDGPAPVFAPLALAMSAQYAIWATSGLENALFGFFLALGIERTVTESRFGGFWGSALAWLGLAWTRPEGLLYAAVGGFWFLVALARARKPLGPVAGWLAVFWVPTLLLEGLRWWYFAWAVPQTWYAKIYVRSTYPMSWNERGWFQIRDWADRLWQGWFLPIYVVGALGRRRLAFVVVGVLALTLLYPAPQLLRDLPFWPDLPAPPDAWLRARVVLYALFLVGLPAFDVGRPGWEPRVLCWHTAAAGLLFSVYANGDWMGAYRFMSLWTAPVTVLFAVGLREIADAADRALATAPGAAGRWGTAGWLAVAFGLGVWIPPDLFQSRDHLYFNTDETAKRMMARVDYTESVRRLLYYEGQVYNAEMDQGGTIWQRPEWIQVDMAGLVDVPMAHHNFGHRAFVEQYIFGERMPTFAHAHGWWAGYSAFLTYPQWKQMFRLPKNQEPVIGIVDHGGMWANRGMLFEPAWPGVAREAAYDQDVALRGVTVPVDAWPAGADGYLEIGLSSPPRAAGGDLQLLVFLSQGDRVAATWSLPIGSGLIGMDQWRAEEVYVGRFAVAVPELPEGRYDLGVVLLDADGAALPAGGAAGDRPVDPTYLRDPPVLARGEVRLPGAVAIEGLEAVVARAEAARREAIALAAAGSCDEAEAKWIVSERYQPRQWDFHAQALPPVARAIADCLAARAERIPERAAALLREAHRWDHDSPELARVGEPLGARLWDEAMAARARGDHDAAYIALEALLAFQPWRSWARKYAEDERDAMLGIDRAAPWRPVVPKGSEMPEGFGPDGPLSDHAPQNPTGDDQPVDDVGD